MNLFPKIGKACFLLIPFTLCFWERGNTYVAILYGLAVLVQPGLRERFRKALKQKWVFPFLALYAFTAFSAFWSADLARAAFVLEKKSALVAFPVLAALDGQLSWRLVRQAMLCLVGACVLALWAALAHAVGQYPVAGDISVFFYHHLGWVLDEFNAVYFSLYVFMSLVFFDFLVREKAFSFIKPAWIKGLVWGTLALGIVLLSSRLFILLAVVYGLVRLTLGRKGGGGLGGVRNRGWVILFLAFALLAVLVNQGRFRELVDSRFEVLQQEQFRWDTPFNGLTLRLLLLRFGWQALEENQAWAAGLGVGDVRPEINSLILRHNLYHGNPELGDTGYLNYSLHNQYLETWLQAGLPALAAWLWLLAMGWRAGLREGILFPLLWLVLAVASFSLFESVLERQRGVVFFVFFLSALYSSINYENPEIPSTGTRA
ncbi:MAG: hypothetical protein J5I98_28820 [Phaeodactylibacter sp.]|nr:hypothetical protein [Phaeodactylibacter sp.]